MKAITIKLRKISTENIETMDRKSLLRQLVQFDVMDIGQSQSLEYNVGIGQSQSLQYNVGMFPLFRRNDYGALRKTEFPVSKKTLSAEPMVES